MSSRAFISSGSDHPSDADCSSDASDDDGLFGHSHAQARIAKQQAAQAKMPGKAPGKGNTPAAKAMLNSRPRNTTQPKLRYGFSVNEALVRGRALQARSQCEFNDVQLWETRVKNRTLETFFKQANDVSSVLSTHIEVPEAQAIATELFDFTGRCEHLAECFNVARTKPLEFLDKFAAYEHHFADVSPHLISNVMTTICGLLTSVRTPEAESHFFTLTSRTEVIGKFSIGNPMFKFAKGSDMQHQLIAMWYNKLMVPQTTKQSLVNMFKTVPVPEFLPDDLVNLDNKQTESPLSTNEPGKQGFGMLALLEIGCLRAMSLTGKDMTYADKAACKVYVRWAEIITVQY